MYIFKYIFIYLPTYNPGQNVWDKVPFSRIAAIFARSPLHTPTPPLPHPPDAMLDDSSASLPLRTTLHGGRGGGKVGFGPKNVCFLVKNWSMVEAVHSASLSHIILARIVATYLQWNPVAIATTGTLKSGRSSWIHGAVTKKMTRGRGAAQRDEKSGRNNR